MNDLQQYDNDLPVLTYKGHNNYLEFLLECIPNHGKAQPWNVWWTVGQALKNIESDDRNTNPHIPDSYYLDIWIKWSLKAKGLYPNNKQACLKFWNKMKCREYGAPKYEYSLLIGMANYYYSDEFIECF